MENTEHFERIIKRLKGFNVINNEDIPLFIEQAETILGFFSENNEKVEEK